MNGTGNTVEAEPIQLEGFGPRDLYQRREKIFTRYVGGFYQKLRFFTGWPLLTGYFLLPWLSWGGKPLVLFDLPAREFHILNLTFYPQDMWLLGWLLIIAAFGLFTVTTLVGRLWCGYTCPQTVWTAVFMWAEQIAEGPRHKRIRLDAASWSLEKLLRRLTKHGMWLGFAAFTGLAFVGYFTPMRYLVVDLVTLNANGWAVFWIAFFTGATYINAGWMREQVCIYMCPYARFQSAMLDKDTLIVSYDAGRGEPRGARKRFKSARSPEGAETAQSLGDCIDCQLCVQVCPTGIDIRNGLQYECIGCAHCIDACNQVMDKMDYPRGLVRYTTEHELTEGRTRWFRGRSAGYVIVLAIMLIAFIVAIFNRSEFELNIIRERGELFQTTTGGDVTNQYSLKVLNKTQTTVRYSVSVEADMPVDVIGLTRLQQKLNAEPGELLDLGLTLAARREAIALPNTDIRLTLCETGTTRCVSRTTSFLGPAR